MNDSDREKLKPGRRDFLEVATAGGVAGASVLGLSSCFGILGRAGPVGALDEQELQARMRLLDGGLETLSTRRFVTDVILGEPNEAQVADEAARIFASRSDLLTRRALRALLFLAVYIDLPEESRSHPDVQRRVELFSPELEEALSEMSTLLSTYPTEELAQVEQALRSDPSLLMRYCEILDVRSRDEGLARPSRRLIRAVGRRLTNGLRVSSLESIIGECLSAFEGVLDEAGADVSALYERETRVLSGLWESTDHHRLAKDKSPEEMPAQPGEMASTQHQQGSVVPCAQEVESGYIISGGCPAPDGDQESASPEPRSLTTSPEERRREEYRQWREAGRTSNRTGSELDRRHQIGRRMTIAGAVLLLACGAGILVLIPGAIILGISNRERRRRQPTLRSR